MQKEYLISPYVEVLRDAPHGRSSSYAGQVPETQAHFDDLHHLLMKKVLDLKDHTYTKEEGQKLQALLSEVIKMNIESDPKS